MIGAMGDDHRRGKITAEHIAEARRLRDLWNRTKAARAAAGVGTQESFGQAFDIGNQAAVGFFLNGRTALSLKAARGFARGLQCSVDEFSPRLAAQLTPLELPRVNEPTAIYGTPRAADAVGHLAAMLRHCDAAELPRLAGLLASLALNAGAAEAAAALTAELHAASLSGKPQQSTA